MPVRLRRVDASTRQVWLLKGENEAMHGDER